MSRLRLVDFDRRNLDPYLDMTVRPDQEGLVAPNAITVAQCAYEPAGEVWGLADGDTPVGLLAMIDLEEPGAEKDKGDPDNAAYIWRLMIAADHQGKGHGRAAMDLAYGVARDWGRTVMTVSVVEREGSALPLYLKFGLQPTDRIEGGERLLIGPVSAAT